MRTLHRWLRAAIAAAVFSLVVFSGCKNDISGPGSDSNLISNPSFESDVKWELDGWNLNDTLYDTIQHFSNDVPVLGGNWSLKVDPDFSPDEGFADYYLVGPRDKAVYRLSVWGKTVGGWDAGAVRLLLRVSGSSEVRRSTPVNVDSWQYYSLEDTVRLYETDTLVVRLSAGTGYPDTDDGVLFDEVTLQQLN